MKKLLLFLLLCLVSKAGNSQVTVAGNNNGTCDVIVTFTALDPTTCMILATSSTFYLIPNTGFPPGPPFTITWVPSAPTATYIVKATVTYAGCVGCPPANVGGAPSACFYNPVDLIPPAGSCGPDHAIFPSDLVHPASPIAFPLNINTP